jgi:hypothetical protein
MWLPKGSYGTHTVRIKKFTEYVIPCKSCRALDANIEVFQDYYHFLFIPFIAKPGKTARIRCSNCGEPVLTTAVLKEYELKTKTPFYLYSGTIFFAILIAIVAFISFRQQLATEDYAAHPQVGDVYRVKNTKTNSYYFLKLKKIQGDTLVTYQNNFLYYTATDELQDKNDLFYPGETLLFTKKEIQQKQASDEIDVIYRGYDSTTGFNREQIHQ